LIFDYLTIFKSVEICKILFESLRVSKYVETLQIFGIWLNFTASVLTVSSLSTDVHKLSIYGAAFWILMGRVILIRVWKLVSSGVSTGWIDVFSGGHW
jgi:hypothetical protein